MRKSTLYLYVLGLAVGIGLLALTSASPRASAQNSNSSTTAPTKTDVKKKTRKPRSARTGRCDPNKQEQTDLSGTYTGKVTHGDKTMDGTLTITGNDYTATTGSDTHSGRITAVTTCGYTAVAMTMQPGKPSVSLRARKVGDQLTLTSVPGEPEKITFTTGGGATKAKHRRHRKAKTTTTTSPAPAKKS